MYLDRKKRHMEITWIGGGGFIFEDLGHRLVVDPYLSDVVERTLKWTRLEEPPISTEDLRPDIVFCSHNHIDHLDTVAAPEIAEYYPACRFIGPKSVTDDLVGMDIDTKRLTTLKPGKKIQMECFELIAIPAYHSDKYSIGLIVEANQKKIYISADTLYHPELARDVLDYSGGDIDLVLICINGRLGNMDTDEAINIVGKLQPRIASPMHYGLFAENTEDPGLFVNKCKEIGISSFLFKTGRPVNLDKLLVSYKE